MVCLDEINRHNRHRACTLRPFALPATQSCIFAMLDLLLHRGLAIAEENCAGMFRPNATEEPLLWIVSFRHAPSRRANSSASQHHNTHDHDYASASGRIWPRSAPQNRITSPSFCKPSSSCRNVLNPSMSPVVNSGDGRRCWQHAVCLYVCWASMPGRSRFHNHGSESTAMGAFCTYAYPAPYPEGPRSTRIR